MPTKPARRYLVALGLLPVLFLLGGFVLLTAGGGCGGTVTTEPGTKRVGPESRDDPLEAARQILAGSPDPAACTTATQQLNAYLAAHPDQRPPGLGGEQRDLLQKRFGLDAGELGEVGSTSYTLLDAHYLGLCFLLRDAARSLEVEKLSPAEQAATAFAWVMRQVLLQEGSADFPPEFVLRRGWGTGEERAHVFLALLHQMGIPGCFVMTPGADRAWACGALVPVGEGGEKQVLLFDCRLGLPLPGPKGPPDGELARAHRLASPVPGPRDGQQVATLAALRKQPELLKPLTTDEKQPFDVGAEQVKDAAVRLAPPLSALSPRMRALQDDLLPQRVGVRLAADPAELIRQLGSAAGVEGGADSVRGRDGAPGVQRRFLGEREGGTDKGGRLQRAQLDLIPQQTLPRQVQELEGEPRTWIWAYFAHPFVTFQLEPRMPRDLVLRGQLKEAAGQLAPLLEQYRIQKDRLQSDPEVYEKFERWKDDLYQAYGAMGRAQDEARKGGSPEAADAAAVHLEQVKRSGEKVLSVLVDGSAARPRAAQAMYQMALCLHEQAERLQAHADRLARAAPPGDAEAPRAREAARGAWKDAAGWWDSCIQEYPVTPFSVHARLLHARSRDALGNRDRARALLEDFAGEVPPPQKTARLYLARRLQAQVP